MNWACTNNQAPVATDQTHWINEDNSGSYYLGWFVSDAEGDALTYQVTQTGGNGTFNTSNLPWVTFTPNGNWYGSTSFKYRAHDGRDWSATKTVVIHVNSYNDPPSVSINQGHLWVGRNSWASRHFNVWDTESNAYGLGCSASLDNAWKFSHASCATTNWDQFRVDVKARNNCHGGDAWVRVNVSDPGNPSHSYAYSMLARTSGLPECSFGIRAERHCAGRSWWRVCWWTNIKFKANSPCRCPGGWWNWIWCWGSDYPC